MEEAARPKELRALPSVKDVGSSALPAGAPCVGLGRRAGEGWRGLARAAPPARACRAIGTHGQLLTVPPCLHRSCWRRCSRRSSERRRRQSCSERDAALCLPAACRPRRSSTARRLVAPADAPGPARELCPGAAGSSGGGSGGDAPLGADRGCRRCRSSVPGRRPRMLFCRVGCEIVWPRQLVISWTASCRASSELGTAGAAAMGAKITAAAQLLGVLEVA
jgi:hypothetical protein